MNPAPKILIIDDEAQIRRLLRSALEGRGYMIYEAENGTLGLSEAVVRKPDAILLDLGLPDIDGLEVLKRLREWSEVPVLILSVRDSEYAKVAALEAGADDYITKPFSAAELMARLTAIRRRSTADTVSSVRLGHIEIDFSSRIVTVNGKAVHLTPTEYALFKVLIHNSGKVVTHKHLLRDVWGQSAGEQAQYLRVYITHLRKKLELSSDSAVRLINEAGVGYRLIG